MRPLTPTLSPLRREREKQTRALLDAVMKDETQHESYSLALTQTLGGSLARARAWELKRGWLRAGAAVTGLVFTALTSVLYLLLFPLALIEKARRPE